MNGCKRNSDVSCNMRWLQQLCVETDKEMLNVCGNVLLKVAQNCNLYWSTVWKPRDKMRRGFGVW